MYRLIFVVSLSLIVGVCSAKKVANTTWEEGRYQNPDSIHILSYKYDSDSQLFYMLTNDSTNLYIHAKFVGDMSQRNLLRAGLIIWLDPMAKGKKNIGIKYPLPPNDREQEMGRGSNEETERGSGRGMNKPTSLSDDMKRQHISKINTLELIHFPNKAEIEFVSTLDNEGVWGNLQLSESGNIHYTLIVPFDEMGVKYESGMILSLRVESGKIESTDRPDNMSSGGRPGGMSGGGMGGGPGGGGGQGGGAGRGGGGGGGGGGQQQMGGNSQQESNLSSQIKIKIKQLQLM